MSDLALIAQDPSALELAGDAGEFVVLACERAKTWLTQAIEHGDIDQIVEMKSQADAIRVYTRQKELGKDAELAAAEIVRRAERGLGIAIKRGQEEGTIAKPGDVGGLRTTGSFGGAEAGRGRGQHLLKPSDVVPDNNARSEFYNWAAKPDDEFDEALAEAKAEGNLSRANVDRKVKGVEKMTPEARRGMIRSLASSSLTSVQIAAKVGVSAERVRQLARDMGIEIHADKALGKTRKIDSDRIIASIVDRVAFDIESDTAQLIDYEALNPARLEYWVSSLAESISSLTKLRNRLQKELTRE